MLMVLSGVRSNASLVLLVAALLVSRLAEAQCGGSAVYLSIALPVAFTAANIGGGITTTVYASNRRAPRVPVPVPSAAPPDPSQGQSFPEEPSAPPVPLSCVGPKLDEMLLARTWLVANELQLKQDLALGAGPALADLAGFALIPPRHRDRFGLLLKRHRERLIVPRDPTPRQAAEVMARVGELIMADPVLRVEGEAVQAMLAL